MLEFLGRVIIWGGTISVVAASCLLIGFALGQWFKVADIVSFFTGFWRSK